MKKEITIYELLGLIKDGKAPKKIMYNDNVYEFNDYDYRCIVTEIERGFVDRRLIKNYNQNLQSILNEKVEIIEEPKELEEIEFKFNNGKRFMISNIENINYEVFIDTKELVLATKINEIIKYITDKENK